VPAMQFNYEKFYTLSPAAFTGKCKLCTDDEVYAYAAKSKSNLKHHLQIKHQKEFEAENSKNKTKVQTSLVVSSSKVSVQIPAFIKQDKITDALVKLLIGQGGLPVTTSTT
jgi:hypothetical protein